MDDSTDERSDLAGIRAACEQRGVELDVITKPSQLSAVIQRQKPTVGLVLGWYWILPDSMLSLFPRGVLGIHASLLPSLRGNAPLVWARLLGLPETGVSLFYFDDGIDTGDIVGQMVIPIDDKDTIADLLAKADVCAADLIAANIEDLLRGTAPRVIQRTDGVSYVGLRRARRRTDRLDPPRQGCGQRHSSADPTISRGLHESSRWHGAADLVGHRVSTPLFGDTGARGAPNRGRGNHRVRRRRNSCPRR